MKNIADINVLTVEELKNEVALREEKRVNIINDIKSGLQSLCDKISDSLSVQHVTSTGIEIDIKTVSAETKNRAWNVFRIAIDDDWRDGSINEIELDVMKLSVDINLIKIDENKMNDYRALVDVYTNYVLNDKFLNELKSFITSNWSSFIKINDELSIIRAEISLRETKARKEENKRKMIDFTKNAIKEIKSRIDSGDEVFIRTVLSQTADDAPAEECELLYRGKKYVIAPDSKGEYIFVNIPRRDNDTKFISWYNLKDNKGNYIFRD